MLIFIHKFCVIEIVIIMSNSQEQISTVKIVKKLLLLVIFSSLLRFSSVKSSPSPQRYSSKWGWGRPSRLLDRTVTDPGAVENPFGIPVDFSYNETRQYYNWPWHMNSVPGCPKSIDGHPWVYFGNPPRCYLAGSRGPCDANRVIMLEMYSPYGICACECLPRRFEFGDREVLSDDGRYIFCSPHYYKNQVFDKAEKICYDLNERGPCEVGSCLMRDPRSNTARCIPNCDAFYLYDWWDSGCKKCPTSPSKGGPSGGNPDIHGSPWPCLSNERYSPLLRRCIKENWVPNSALVIS